jgi:hypothetical protein
VLPPLRSMEDLTDPKVALLGLLKKASGLTGRRLKSFDARARVHRLAQLIEDYSPLLVLPAFQALDVAVKQSVLDNGWH